jgi:hypothetical protein
MAEGWGAEPTMTWKWYWPTAGGRSENQPDLSQARRAGAKVGSLLSQVRHDALKLLMKLFRLTSFIQPVCLIRLFLLPGR